MDDMSGHNFCWRLKKSNWLADWCIQTDKRWALTKEKMCFPFFDHDDGWCPTIFFPCCMLTKTVLKIYFLLTVLSSRGVINTTAFKWLTAFIACIFLFVSFNCSHTDKKGTCVSPFSPVYFFSWSSDKQIKHDSNLPNQKPKKEEEIGNKLHNWSISWWSVCVAFNITRNSRSKQFLKNELSL